MKSGLPISLLLFSFSAIQSSYALTPADLVHLEEKGIPKSRSLQIEKEWGANLSTNDILSCGKCSNLKAIRQLQKVWIGPALSFQETLELPNFFNSHSELKEFQKTWGTVFSIQNLKAMKASDPHFSMDLPDLKEAWGKDIQLTDVIKLSALKINLSLATGIREELKNKISINQLISLHQETDDLSTAGKLYTTLGGSLPMNTFISTLREYKKTGTNLKTANDAILIWGKNITPQQIKLLQNSPLNLEGNRSSMQEFKKEWGDKYTPELAVSIGNADFSHYQALRKHLKGSLSEDDFLKLQLAGVDLEAESKRIASNSGKISLNNLLEKTNENNLNKRANDLYREMTGKSADSPTHAKTVLAVWGRDSKLIQGRQPLTETNLNKNFLELEKSFIEDNKKKQNERSSRLNLERQNYLKKLAADKNNIKFSLSNLFKKNESETKSSKELNVSPCGHENKNQRYDQNNLSMSHVEVREQGDVGTCYAQSAAQLVDALRFSSGQKNYSHQTSGIVAALNMKAEGGHDNGTTYSSMSTGETCEAFNSILKHGSCEKDLIEGNSSTQKEGLIPTHSQQLFFNQLDSYLVSLYSTPDESKHHRLNEDICIACRSSFFHSSVGNIISHAHNISNILKTPYSLQRTRQLVVDACAKNKKILNLSGLKNFICKEVPSSPKENRPSIENLHDYLNKNKKGLPAGLSFCTDIIKNNDYSLPSNSRQAKLTGCSGHATVLLGREEKDGKCYFILRNSWGGDCASIDRDSKNKLVQCEQGTGNIFVEQNLMEKGLLGLSVVEKKASKSVETF